MIFYMSNMPCMLSDIRLFKHVRNVNYISFCVIIRLLRIAYMIEYINILASWVG